MTPRREEGDSSTLLSTVGNRSRCFAKGVGLLLERARHDGLSQDAVSLGIDITPTARSALVKTASRLGICAEQVEPSCLLFAIQTYYAIIVKLLTWSLLKKSSEGSHSPIQDWSRTEYERFESGGWATELGVNGFPDARPWDWYLNAWDEPLAKWLHGLSDHLLAAWPLTVETDPMNGHDLFSGLYMSLLPKQVRHALGEHYTPPWLADHVLDCVGFDGREAGNLLDPTCGSGVFLLRALTRLRQERTLSDGRVYSERVVGMDVNSLAVLAARANYLLAIRDVLDCRNPLTPPIHLCDVVLENASHSQFDFLVGNPPWLAWDHLPLAYRDRTKELWQRYGLFSLSGSEARHGGGKKDLAMLVLYAGADRHLRDGGRLGMVVTQTLFQTRGAGDGFRRFCIGADGTPLKVLRVDDLVDVQPFETASNWTATVTMKKGASTTYPVHYVRWLRDDKPKGGAGLSPCGASCSLEAQPIDSQRPQSPWIVRPANLSATIDLLARPSEYTAHLGANTGGANGVYWLRLLGRKGEYVEVENLPSRGKQSVPAVRATLEPGLLYPLVRWSDIGRFCAKPSAHLLLVQDPVTRRGIDQARLNDEFPATSAYLKRFEPMLRRRAAYRRYQDSAPFYSMYNVGEYTLAPFKVVWRRMDRQIRAAVLAPVDDPWLGRRPVVCQETCVMIATESADEGHYLAAVLNSSVIGFLVEAHNVRGGKGFGSPGMLEFLGIRRFDEGSADHQELARLSQAAHRVAGRNTRLIDEMIDEIAARIFGIEPSDARLLAEFTYRSK